jgi:hypothetical protein
MKNQSGTVRIHHYRSDGTDDGTGRSRCLVCTLPFANRAHKVPQVTDEQRAAEARRTGER